MSNKSTEDPRRAVCKIIEEAFRSVPKPKGWTDNYGDSLSVEQSLIETPKLRSVTTDWAYYALPRVLIAAASHPEADDLVDDVIIALDVEMLDDDLKPVSHANFDELRRLGRQHFAALTQEQRRAIVAWLAHVEENRMKSWYNQTLRSALAYWSQGL